MDDRQDLAGLIDDVSRGLPNLSPDDRLRQMGAMLREHPIPKVREAAAYGLRHDELHASRTDRVIELLLEVLGNAAEAGGFRQEGTRDYFRCHQTG